MTTLLSSKKSKQLTGHNLMAQHGFSSLFMTKELEHQTDPAGLRGVLDQVQGMIPRLWRQGLRAGQLSWLMADLIRPGFFTKSL